MILSVEDFIKRLGKIKNAPRNKSQCVIALYTLLWLMHPSTNRFFVVNQILK